MTTETVKADLVVIREFDVMERLRAGQSVPEIAEAHGVTRQVIQAHIKELAEYARKNARDAAAVAFMVAGQRFEDVYRKAHDVAADTTADIELRMKAMTLCLQATQKVCDLHQLGRPGTQGHATFIMTAEDMTDAEAILAARRVGLTIPTSIETTP